VGAGVADLGQRGERGEALPVGGGIAAVDRTLIVEAVVADRHELRVEIGDMTVGIRVDRVVRGIGLERRRLHVAGEIARLGPQPALLERRDRPVHQGERDPALAFGADDRAVMGGIGGEVAHGEAAVGLAHAQRDRPRPDRAQGAAVAVEEAIAATDDGLGELVDRIDAARRMHPAEPLVEPLVDEELAPGRCAVGVQALCALHAELGAEEEAGVRIDQQQRAAVAGQRRRDRDAVRAARLLVAQSGRGVPLAVEGGELDEVGALDVAADAPFREGERHPRLEPGEHARTHLGMGGEIIVQPLGPGVHQRAQPKRAAAIIGLELRGIDPEPLAQVLPDRALALGFGGAAERGQIIGLDAGKVVLGLGIDRAEHGIGVAFTPDMGDPPIVAGDGDARGAGIVDRHRRRGADQERENDRGAEDHEDLTT
jgi:hypothetical protein